MLNFLLKRLSLTEFFNLANISRSVKESLASYCKTDDRYLIQILMYQDDKLPELLEELMIQDLEGLEKWFQLLRTQRIFEHQFVGTKLMGLSMIETLQELEKAGGSKAARDFSESIK